jgi:predicted transcriptional regulator
MRELDDIAAELAAISERLTDASLAVIGRALDESEDHERAQLAVLEKRIGKARRAVEKAIHDLTGN